MERPVVKKEQLEFLDWEFGAFFHFGIRTFYEGHVDWDLKEMPADGFNPTNLDCDSWIRKIKEAGMTYAVLVCKHHDGFANWPSAYTDYSVKNTPWKDGKGDVVKDYTDACRKYGLKTGLYYSPAQFGSVKMNAQEYDEYFINQISELLTNYGKIDYLWFDGCGSEGHTYDFDRITKAIREMQPGILIFNMGDPDTYWCGNESGYCPSPNFNFRPYDGGTRFLPYECDCRIRENWFYFDADKPTLKSLDELMGMYIHSVGRGSNLLLNIAPDRDGQIGEEDTKRLMEFGDEIRRRFANPIISVDKPEITDNSVSTFSETFRTMNAVIIKENPAAEKPVTFVKLYGQVYGNDGEDKIFLGAAESVGHKLIITFPDIIIKRVIAEFECEGKPEILSFEVCGK